MRLFIVLSCFCVTLSFATVQGQTTASNGDRPFDYNRTRFRLSDVDEEMVREFKAAWRRCFMGTTKFEAAVLVRRQSDGSVKGVSPDRTNQSYEFTFTWDPAIVAIFHTHPNNRNPIPARHDILVARRFDIPIFTLTRRGMYMYDPATDSITKVKSGIDWLDSSSWTTNRHLAVK